RRALWEGLRVGRTRESFGQPVREHPLYRRDLLELTCEVEGALAFVLDTADTIDRWASGDEAARPVLRMLTPLAKAVTGKLAVSATSRGCEFLGGNGYIEDYVTPRLLRDAQVLPIWEGTTNIQCLDMLRAVSKEDALPAFLSHVRTHLEAGEGAKGATEAVKLVEQSISDLAGTARDLQEASPKLAQARARDVVWQAFHTHAAALLIRRVTVAEDPERASTLAELYARLFVGDDRHRGQALLAELAADGPTSLFDPGAPADGSDA
ncbi:MAG: acyl-CoA dehydrogenase family protein, partial [Candidatus Thermoplasmatota archaeon]|nr:acyl-CoA dehydrogenase family protein [Candidatus Thermoplasmatota archaeon]